MPFLIDYNETELGSAEYSQGSFNPGQLPNVGKVKLLVSTTH